MNPVQQQAYDMLMSLQPVSDAYNLFVSSKTLLIAENGESDPPFVMPTKEAWLESFVVGACKESEDNYRNVTRLVAANIRSQFSMFEDCINQFVTI